MYKKVYANILSRHKNLFLGLKSIYKTAVH